MQEILDSFFIMALCFATLLTAMLLKGETAAVTGYHIQGATLAVFVLGLVLYLTFILRKSDLQLKDIVSSRFTDEKKPGGQK